MSDKYYSCEYILTLKDINGKRPEIYLVDGNRTAGKSVSFKKKLTDTFLKRKSDINQFLYIFRYKTDMQNVSEMFFGDIGRIFYRGHVMTEKKLFEGKVIQLLLDDEPCGYAVPLSMSSKIKNASAIFTRVKHGFFDEYQAEDDQYLNNEINKFMSLHTTVARGDGEQVRYVPFYMASNTVSMLNPYYHAFGINKRLQHNTKFLKGDGWVFERTYNETASKAFQESAFNRAFQHSAYFKYASENVYLNDNMALIEKPKGTSRYLLTIKYNNQMFNVREYDTCVYVSHGCDETFRHRYCFQHEDVTGDGTVMVNRNDFMIDYLRRIFRQGYLRFDSLEAKNMTLDMISFY